MRASSSLKCVISALIAAVVPCSGCAQIAGSGNRPRTEAASPRTAVQPPWPSTGGRIRELEDKAAERDKLAETCAALELEVRQLRRLVAKSRDRSETLASPHAPGRLETLEARAQESAALSTELAHAKVKITQLQRQLTEEQEVRRKLLNEITELQCQIEDLGTRGTEQSKQLAALRRNLDEVLLGKYEYYEVKEGDTLASIAAQPQIYGDEKRKEWIRQANARRLDNLSDLRAKQILIIPRFPPSGRYEF